MCQGTGTLALVLEWCKDPPAASAEVAPLGSCPPLLGVRACAAWAGRRPRLRREQCGGGSLQWCGIFLKFFHVSKRVHKAYLLAFLC